MDVMIGKAAWVVLAVAWWVMRLPFERKAKKARIAVDDMKTPERIRLAISLAGLGVVPFLYVAFGFPAFADYAPNRALLILGIVAVVAALVMFRLTHKALGRYWSVSLQLREEHKLITKGIYSRIRHPMYSAFWLWAIAQALLLPNWIAGFAGIVGFGTLYLLRVGHEEKLMVDAFGDEYRAYMERTGRLLPKF
jgi:protein-S-isoprenylcysteine O-methyltransferase Ste14